MFGAPRNPISAYASVNVETSVAEASPHKLVLLLFDGAIQACVAARLHMEHKQIAEKGTAVSKAINIITNGLKASLDMESGGELAERLAALYDYMVQRLLYANLKNQPAALSEVIALLTELRDAWAQIAPEQQKVAAA
ncbi:MAG: Flagellar protein FliS [Betaproteobacteria bacterium ADurb.Bin341]|nr:MAG: Flagellar protein FliS [Betaproteobacteria bacterium ADurb.Bin341]